jgi:hypothetical protein
MGSIDGMADCILTHTKVVDTRTLVRELASSITICIRRRHCREYQVENHMLLVVPSPSNHLYCAYQL